MRKGTRGLVLGALFSALAVVSLYIASLWPTGQLGFAAVAALFIAAAVIESGSVYGALVFVVTSLISFFIMPNRAPLLLFICFFGYYPILKSLAERLRNIIVQTIIKLAVFNLALTAVRFLFSEMLLGGDGNANVRIVIIGEFDVEPFYLYIIGSLGFLAYDYGFTKLIRFYINRISKNAKEQSAD